MVSSTMLFLTVTCRPRASGVKVADVQVAERPKEALSKAKGNRSADQIAKTVANVLLQNALLPDAATKGSST